MKQVRLELIQGTSTLTFTKEIASDKITEIAGTIAQNVLNLYSKSRKFKMDLGFSFARKFDMKVTIDGVTSDFGKITGTESVKFGVTISDKNFMKFVEFVHEFTRDAMTGESELIVDLDEVELN